MIHARSRRRFRTRSIRRLALWFPLLFGGILTLTIVLAIVLRIDRTVQAQGVVVVDRYQIVRPIAAGVIVEVRVEPGQIVRRGQALARIANVALERELLEVDQNLLETRARLDRTRADLALARVDLDPRQGEIERTRIAKSRLLAEHSAANRAEFEIDLESRRLELERTKELDSHGLVSRQAVAAVDAAARAARERVNQRLLEERLAYSDVTQAKLEQALRRKRQRVAIKQLESEAQTLAAEVEQKLEQRRFLTELSKRDFLYASLDGVVAGPPKLQLLGRSVAAGEEIFEIVDPASIRFLSQVPEEALLSVRKGQSVRLELAGISAQRFRHFRGEVQRVEDYATPSDGAPPMFEVEIQIAEPWLNLDEGRFYLRRGMRGRAEIAYQREASPLRVLLEFMTGKPALPERSGSGV